jgi:hypothetical protein
MTLFEKWKKGFDAWEVRAAKASSKVLESPRVLEPSGALISAVMRGKARTDRALTSVWSAVGLPNRRDQERTLRLLTVLERRVIDLEEKLEDTSEALRRARDEGSR